MNTHYFKVMGIFVLLLTAVLSPTVATTYKLVKVTSVEAGKMYVFEQGFKNASRVMNNNFYLNGLNTTSTYNTTGLSGEESYVWTLESSGNAFKMKNKHEEKYLKYSGTSTNLEWASNFSGASSWTFTYITETSNDYFVIELVASQKRFLGFYEQTKTGYLSEYVYRAYTWNTAYPERDALTPYFINVYQLVEETSEDVTVSTAGMATYVSDNDLDYSNVEGLKAYKAKVSGNDITFTAVGQVPAGEGVLLKATTTLESNTVYTIPFATASVTAWAADDNDFIRGTGAAVPSYSEEGSYYNYILNKKGGVVGFYKAAGQTVAANRAYLRTTAAPSTSANAMSFSFEEGTTGIKEEGIAKRDNQFADAEWYDLQGRKLSNIPTVAGLYIVNGKKVVVK